MPTTFRRRVVAGGLTLLVAGLLLSSLLDADFAAAGGPAPDELLVPGMRPRNSREAPGRALHAPLRSIHSGTRRSTMKAARLSLSAAAATLTGLALVVAAQGAPTASKRSTAVKIAGGHTTDARDAGRPVVLIAAALGVPADVFRQAFSAVNPAGAGEEPSGEQVQANKAALLRVLAPYGVTNERLDEVSDYYRYNGSAGEVWRQVHATAKAVLRNGKVVSVRIVGGGAGYSSAPKVTLTGYPKVKVRATIAHGTNLATNGRVSKLTIVR